MARKRMIDPSFWDDEDFFEASAKERLLFVSLFSMADDYGHIAAHPATLHKNAYAYDKDTSIEDVAQMRGHLIQNCRNVFLYMVNGQEFLWLRGFKQHQDLRFRAKGQYPCHACGCRHTAEDYDRAGCANLAVAKEFLRTSCVDIAHILPPDYVEENRSHVEENRDTCPPAAAAPSGAEPKLSKPSKKQKGYPVAFEAFWNDYPRKEAKRAAFKSYQKAVKSGVDPPILLIAARHYAQKCRIDGTEEKFTCLATTFLNQGRWEDYQKPPKAPANRAPPRNGPITVHDQNMATIERWVEKHGGTDGSERTQADNAVSVGEFPQR